MRVDQAVGQTLARLGVEHAFGVIGSGNLIATNALVAGGAAFVPARHEGGAVTMADAYARVTGRVGVCSVHQGPGLTNTMTGLTEAAKSRTPLVVLAADTPAADIRSNFRIDQDAMVAAVGAVPERVYGPDTAVADTVRAYRRALAERRAVVLMLPLDVAAGQVSEPVGPGVDVEVDAGWLPPDPPAPAPEAVGTLADALAGGSRPLLLAGRGAVRDGAGAALAALADQTGALLATSAVANGLFAGNPWSLGISGGFASPLAAELIAAADVVIGFGVSFTGWTTRRGRLIGPAATLAQVDLDAAALGAHRPVDLGVIGGVGQTARALSAELRRRGHRPAGWRTPDLAGRIAAGQWPDVPYSDASTDTRIDPRALSVALAEILPAERTVVTDSGHFMGFPAMYLSVPDAAGFVFTQAFQSIGLGLASAIGAALARPDRLTVAALGDGGALMGLSELETACRLSLHLLVVVYNDAAYGAEVHHFGPMGEPLDLVRFPDTDFAALARGLGAQGATVRRRADLAAVAEWLEGGRSGPFVLDARVVPTVVADWLADAFR
ncbi:MAG TPA: thiamine pyrophosphate-binding protein [Mycobacteriales bacterium]|nr:thiamine pyrophosphate-binding protein [Mycobacteriales bacterium]